MQTFARFAKTAGQKAVPVALVAGAASSSVALADAPRGEVVSHNNCSIHAAWEFAELDKDVVLFKPADVDEAISELCRHPQSAVIEELETSDISSDGTIDAILEYSGHTAASESSVGLPLSMHELMTVASKMLMSPGLQREMIIAAVSDPEVFGILADKVDLPQYLESTGFAAKGLLQAPEQGGSSSKLAVFEDDTTASSDENLLVMLSAKAAEGIEHVGNTVASLGRWMRSRIVGDQAAAARTTEAAAERASDSSNGVNKRVDSVLGAVMVICVAIVAVVVLRKPAALKEVFKRVRLVRRA